MWMQWFIRSLCYVVICAFLYHAGSAIFENIKFAKTGKLARIEPFDSYTDHALTQSKFGVKVSEDHTYVAEIQFKTQDNQLIKKVKKLPEDVLNEVKAGKAIYIRYLPENPRQARFDSEQVNPLYWIVIALILIFIEWKLFRFFSHVPNEHGQYE